MSTTNGRVSQKERILAEIAETEALNDLLKKKQKELQATLRKTKKAQFYGISRRQMIEPGRAMTVDEIAASTGKLDHRQTRQACEKRGMFIDDEFGGLVMTDDFLERQMEHIRRCRENESD